MKHLDRSGLYIMVIITMFASCQSNDKLNRIERELTQIQNQTSVCYKEEQ